MMAVYRKKPELVKAIQWFNGLKVEGVVEHKGCGYRMCDICGGDPPTVTLNVIKTSTRNYSIVYPGDYILFPDNGTEYPSVHNKHHFENNYEKI